MATTYNFTNGSITNHPKMTQTTIEDNQPTVLRHIIDCSLQTLDAASADVGQCLIIPADTTVMACWIRMITAETADCTVNLGYGSDVDYWGQHLNMDTTAGSICKTVLTASETFDAASIADGNEEMEEVTVAGAAIGDIAYATLDVDMADLTVSAYIQAEDQVEVVIANNTGSGVNLASTTLTVFVEKAPLAPSPLHFASADTIDVVMTTTNGDVDMDGAKFEVCALVYKQMDTY